MSTLFPANPIASNPIQLSRNKLGIAGIQASPRDRGQPCISAMLPSQQRTLAADSRRPPRPSGADRVRTDDLRLARAALSQLSYSPVKLEPERPAMVGLGRLELPTSRLSGVRSNQLSYRPRTGNHADSLETRQRKKREVSGSTLVASVRSPVKASGLARS